jgi:hypothetical protein
VGLCVPGTEIAQEEARLKPHLRSLRDALLPARLGLRT